MLARIDRVLAYLLARLHRCSCCHARNRSVTFWYIKGGVYLCGECVHLCEGDCKGIPFRQRMYWAYDPPKSKQRIAFGATVGLPHGWW